MSFITRGANIDKKAQDYSTPLHYTCMRENLESLKVMLEYGAEVNVPDKENQTLLSLSVNNYMNANNQEKENLYREKIKLLLANGANANSEEEEIIIKIIFNKDLDNDDITEEMLNKYNAIKQKIKIKVKERKDKIDKDIIDLIKDKDKDNPKFHMFPYEIWQLIFSYLDPKNYPELSLLSKDFLKTIMKPQLLEILLRQLPLSRKIRACQQN